jgi:low temperature requirement protein LtrA
MTPGPGLTGEERHASWLELFFDLVAVAGIGMLAHLLGEDSSSGGIAVYVIAFTAIWMIWACFTLYGNIAGQEMHVLVILGAMSVLGVMTAAIPEIHGEHATAFAVAYVVGRFLAGRPWNRTTVVADLPVVHAGAGLLPWIVSWWFEGTTQYVLWAVGLGLDLLFLVSTNRDRLVAGITARLDHGRRKSTSSPAIDVVDADVPHLTERLGLFVLIVIGEGLVQIIDAASQAAWQRPLAVTGAGAFALMFGLFAVAVRFGYAGVALLPERLLSPRLSWPAHLVSTLAIATIAALLGDVVSAPHQGVSDHVRWLLVTSYAGYAALSAGILLACRLSRRAARVAAPMGVAALVVAVAGLGAEGVVWVLALGVLAAVAPSARPAPRG